MSPAEIVNTAEFHVYERALYKVRWRRKGLGTEARSVPSLSLRCDPEPASVATPNAAMWTCFSC